MKKSKKAYIEVELPITSTDDDDDDDELDIEFDDEDEDDYNEIMDDMKICTKMNKRRMCLFSFKNIVT
jgi:hypothetical protein